MASIVSLKLDIVGMTIGLLARWGRNVGLPAAESGRLRTLTRTRHQGAKLHPSTTSLMEATRRHAIIIFYEPQYLLYCDNRRMPNGSASIVRNKKPAGSEDQQPSDLTETDDWTDSNKFSKSSLRIIVSLTIILASILSISASKTLRPASYPPCCFLSSASSPS